MDDNHTFQRATSVKKERRKGDHIDKAVIYNVVGKTHKGENRENKGWEGKGRWELSKGWEVGEIEGNYAILQSEKD